MQQNLINEQVKHTLNQSQKNSAKVTHNAQHISAFCQKYGRDIQSILSQDPQQETPKKQKSKHLIKWIKRLEQYDIKVFCKNQNNVIVLNAFYKQYRRQGNQKFKQDISLYCQYRKHTYGSYEQFYRHSRKGSSPCTECYKLYFTFEPSEAKKRRVDLKNKIKYQAIMKQLQIVQASSLNNQSSKKETNIQGKLKSKPYQAKITQPK